MIFHEEYTWFYKKKQGEKDLPAGTAVTVSMDISGLGKQEDFGLSRLYFCLALRICQNARDFSRGRMSKKLEKDYYGNFTKE